MGGINLRYKAVKFHNAISSLKIEDVKLFESQVKAFLSITNNSGHYDIHSGKEGYYTYMVCIKMEVDDNDNPVNIFEDDIYVFKYINGHYEYVNPCAKNTDKSYYDFIILEIITRENFIKRGIHITPLPSNMAFLQVL